MSRARRILPLAVLALACGALLASGAASSLPPGTPKTGMVCAPSSLAGSTRTFTLVANDGTIQTPDGNSVFMWSYSLDGVAGYPSFQYPGPVLCANQGETIHIVLRNALPDPTSMILPGQDSAVSATGGSD